MDSRTGDILNGASIYNVLRWAIDRLDEALKAAPQE